MYWSPISLVLVGLFDEKLVRISFHVATAVFSKSGLHSSAGVMSTPGADTLESHIAGALRGSLMKQLPGLAAENRPRQTTKLSPGLLNNGEDSCLSVAQKGGRKDQ
jgi:hypothetical protein